MALLMVKPAALRERLIQARRAWEELEVGATSYEMRRKAEGYYMSLWTLAKAAGVVQ